MSLKYLLQRAGGCGSEVRPLLFRVQGSGCRVQGAGCRVQGAGFRVQGAGFNCWARVVVFEIEAGWGGIWKGMVKLGPSKGGLVVNLSVPRRRGELHRPAKWPCRGKS